MKYFLFFFLHFIVFGFKFHSGITKKASVQQTGKTTVLMEAVKDLNEYETFSTRF